MLKKVFSKTGALVAAIAIVVVGSILTLVVLNSGGSTPSTGDTANQEHAHTTEQVTDQKDCATEVHFFAADAPAGSRNFGLPLQGNNAREKLDDVQSRYCKDVDLTVADAQHFAENVKNSGLDDFKGLDEQGRLAKANELLNDRDLWRATVKKLVDLQNDDKTKVELVTLSGHYQTMEMIPQPDGKPPLIRVVNTTATAESLEFTMADGTVLYLQTVCGGQPREQLPPPPPQKVFGPKLVTFNPPPSTPPTTPPGPPTKICEETNSCTTTPDCSDTPNVPECQPEENCTTNPDQPKCQHDDCVKTDHPQPGPDYTWDQEKCDWVPPTEECVPADHPKPGPDYTWDETKCAWNPPNQECPEGTTGEYPDCNPPSCPEGQIGTPPNCTTPECPEGTTGTYPNCTPPSCPAGTTGTYPNCQPHSCPEGQVGTYPNCHVPDCHDTNTCPPPPCGCVDPGQVQQQPVDNGGSTPTPGANTPPPPAPPAPADNHGNDDGSNATPPPPASAHGSDSGANDGSVTPVGTHTGSDAGTTTTPPADHDNTVGNADGGNNGVDNNDNSTGNGAVDNPFGG